jgi:hypothetical protein
VNVVGKPKLILLCCAWVAAGGLPSAAVADSVASLAVLHGTCTSMLVPSFDFTRGCRPTLTNQILQSGRIEFTFTIGNGAIVTFSGSAPQIKQGPDTAVQPIDRVVFRVDPAAPPNTMRAVGKCTYSNPYKGPARVSCEGAQREGSYSGEFKTDGSPPTMQAF